MKIWVITETDGHGEVCNVMALQDQNVAIREVVNMAISLEVPTGYSELQFGRSVDAFTKDTLADDIRETLAEQAEYAIGNDGWEIQITTTELV